MASLPALPYPPKADSLLRFAATRRVPIILQTEAAECGLACIAMLAGYHGYRTDLCQLRQRFSLSVHGSTLKQMMDIASQLNFSARGLKLDLGQLSQLALPCILHWNMDHFVVLKRCHKDAITIIDPALGERKIPLSEVQKRFTGVALELTPNAAFKPQKQKQSLGFHHFWSRISGLKRSLALVLVLSMLLQVFAIVSPYYMQTVIDDVILRADASLLTVLALGFGLLLLIEIGTNVLRKVTVLHLSNKLNIQMASNVFHHLIRLPMDYFAKRHMGDVVSRFSSLATIRELLTTGIVTVVIDGLMALITLIVMFLYDAKLSLIVLFIVTLYAALRYALYRPLRFLNEEAILADAHQQSHFMESVRASQTIKLFEQETDRQSQWLNKLAVAMNKKIQLSKWDIGFTTANQLLFGIENILIVYFAAHAVMDNLFTIGMLYAFMSYKTRFVSATDGLIAKMIEFKMLSVHFNRLADIVYTAKDPLLSDAKHSRLDNISRTCKRHIDGKLTVQSGSYRYSSVEPPIFNQLNLCIVPGETVAIVGPSGSGKTTLLKCLMGLLPLTSGRLEIDDIEISQLGGIRSEIAAVMQDDQLLSGSIADNIACFANHIDIERVIWAAKMACIHTDISSMTMQYSTLVGELGMGLSGGQKQRLLIARALYKEPRMLFLDEATSHLDVPSEAAVNQHLSALKVTRIIVAHRLQTIIAADRILKLVDGCLVEISAEQLTNTPTQTSTEEAQGDRQ